jgi:hypothetical protein
MVPACLSIRMRLTTEPVWYWMRSARFVASTVRVFLFGFNFCHLVNRLVGSVDNIDFCALRVVFWRVPCPIV